MNYALSSSNRHRSLWLVTLGWVSFLPSLDAEIVLFSRFSDARASAFVVDSNGVLLQDLPPTQTQTDFLPSNLSVSAEISNDEGASASGNSTSNAAITLDGTLDKLTVTGNATGHADAAATEPGSAGGTGLGEVISLTFTLTDISYTYNLTGQLSGSGGNAFADAELSHLGGDVIFHVGAGFTFNTEHLILAESGTLPPGVYVITIDLNASAGSRGFPSGDCSANFNFLVQPVGAPTPTPSPGIQWNNAAGGSFHTATNWDPQVVPGTNDLAIFGLATAYDVDVGTAATDRLEIRNGDVTFTNIDYTVGSTSFDPAGILLDNSKLTLAGGTLNGVHALIGEGAAAHIDVVSLGFLNLTGSLRVGGPGNGILDISGQGNVVSGEGRIGTGVGGGEVALFGFGSIWSSGNLSVGYSGEGTLGILDGAAVVSEMGFVGFEAGSSGNVGIEGFGDDIGQGSIWTLSSDLTIGAGGTGTVDLFDFGVLNVLGKTTVNGTLTVADGALSTHNSQSLTIGGTKDGKVSVSGFVEDLPGRMNAISELIAGEAGVGQLDILDGGFVSCTNAILGVGATGGFLVTGVNDDPSELTVSSQLTVGRSDLGNLIVSSGAQVSAHDLTAGAQVGGVGIVEVRGKSGVIPSVLAATENVILGLEGKGVLIIEEEGTVTCSSAALGVFAGSEGGAFLGIDNAAGGPAQWLVHGDMMIGGLAPGTVALHNGANVMVDNTLFVLENGSIGGNGTYSAQTVIVDGGKIGPGNSVGTLTIEGNYEQTSTGKLTIETAGLGAGEFDLLHVTGDATLAGTLEMLFPAGYLPKAGDSWRFLEVEGTLSGEFAEGVFPQLLPGFQFDLAQVPGGMVFTAINDAVLAPTFLLNISTRLQVGTDENVLIGGFILLGTEPKKVLIRAIGPSLEALGVTGALADPTLELHDGTGALVGENDNWRTTQIGGLVTGDQYLEIHATGIPPTNDAEAAIIATLEPGAYTAIVAGANGATGVGLAEIYDLGPAAAPAKLANISTRGFVQTGDDVMIGGFILGNQTTEVLVRGIGPSLAEHGINAPLADPMLELHDGNGALIAFNDNWRSDQEAEIEATTIPPHDDLEAAILNTLTPGAYTAILRGVGETLGVALVEAYQLD